MWYPMEYKAWALRGLLVATGLLSALPTSAAVLDVCASCTHTTLDTAFAAAVPDDIIILNGPTDPLQPAEVYTLATDLLVNATKTGIEIRGKSTARPDKIVIQGTGTGPVITVEQGFSIEILGVTISGGTTGILAMQNSNVDIRRCLIDGISGIGVDCSNPEEVYIAGSVIQGSGGDAVRLDLGGELNMTQCTLLSNTGLGVNAIAGVATVASCLIHDSGAGLDGTATSLTVGGNWVTDAAGAALPMPAGVTDAYAIPDVLDPLVTFEQDANAFPGEIDNLFTLPLTGQTAATLSDVTPLGRDFENVLRSTTDPRPGAHERGIPATTYGWIECEIVQRGEVREWVGEGPITIYLQTEVVSLLNANVWIANPTVSLRALGDMTAPAPNQIDLGAVTVASQVDENFGWVEYTIEREEILASFQNIAEAAIDNEFYEIYVQPDTIVIPDTDILDQPEAAGNPAELGRIFGIDTSPPTIENLGALADRYLVQLPNDGGPIDTPLPGTDWGVGRLGDVGANFGAIDESTGSEPQVFFDGVAGFTPALTVNDLSFGIHIEFSDTGSGFATAGMPITETASNQTEREALLYTRYANEEGMAWWSENAESDDELIMEPNAPDITVTYASGGSTLTVDWAFTGAIYNPLLAWHAIANIRVMDLAGNEATLGLPSEPVVPLRPLHLWRLPVARARMVDGPRPSDANPVFTWGLERNGGPDPRDPQPCYPSVQFYVFKLDNTGTIWQDICLDWSIWQPSTSRTITLDSFFSNTQTLRQLMIANGAAVGDQYIMLLRGYDEAGNMQQHDLSGIAIPPVPFGNLPVGGLPNLAFASWGDPGISAAAALDTKVQPVFWHNVDGDRTLDTGERSFGAASRVPLPAIPPEAECSTRVEAGFRFTMEAADSATAAQIFYQLFEDGRLVAKGTVLPGDPASGGIDLSIPNDLFAGSIPAWVAPDPTDPTFINTGFLNSSADYFPCGITVDRLGDDGEPGSESPYRKRDVKYQLLCRTGIDIDPGPAEEWVYDTTPASVEFTVTVDRGLKDDQPIKSFSKE